MTETGRTIGCIVPAHNDERSIGGVLVSLLGQTRVPDVIHVVVENTSDATVLVASEFAGRHEIATDFGAQFAEVFVHDIGESPDRRSGALEYGKTLVEGYDVVLHVEGDTVVEADAVQRALLHARFRTRRSARWVERAAWLTLIAAAVSMASTLVRRQHGCKV